MKKIMFAVLALTFVVSSQFQTFAATTKQGILDAARDTSGIEGRTDPVPDKYVKSLSDFLNTDDFTQEEIDFMSQELAEVKSIWAASGSPSFRDMDPETRNLLQSKATAAAARVGASLTFDGTNVSVISRTGRRYTISGTSGDSWAVSTGDANIPVSGSVIKATGLGINLVPFYALIGSLIAILTLIGAFILKDRKRLLN